MTAAFVMYKISWTGPRLFIIVGHDDNPIYECRFVGEKESSYMSQFILHASLDLVDEIQWKTPTTFLKTIDRYNDLHISAYVTPGSVRFLLLHEAKNEDAVRSFFQDVHELYIKVLLNPFYDHGRIKSAAFDAKVKLSAQSHLRGTKS